MEWYYQTADGPEGPIELERLNAMLAEGALAADVPLRKEGREEWRPAWDLAQLGVVVPTEGEGATSASPAASAAIAVEPSAAESQTVLEALLKPAARVQLILWGAFVYSQLSYVGVVWFVTQKEGVEPVTLPGAFIVAASVAAFIAGVFGLLYRRKKFGDVDLRRSLRELDPDDPKHLEAKDNKPSSEAFRAQFASLSSADKRLYLLMRKTLITRIILLALFEFIAVAGMVLGFAGKELSLTIPFVVAALALTATVFPKSKALVARARQML